MDREERQQHLADLYRLREIRRQSRKRQAASQDRLAEAEKAVEETGKRLVEQFNIDESPAVRLMRGELASLRGLVMSIQEETADLRAQLDGLEKWMAVWETSLLPPDDEA